MANIKEVVPFILSWEGGLSDDPDDKGGPTNKGVTLSNFRAFYGENATIDDLKNITDDQWIHIFRTGYWDKIKGDNINDQSVANILIDWAYNSGPGTAAKGVQQIVGVSQDGIMGPITLGAINDSEPQELFKKLHKRREEFYLGIVERDHSQGKFLKGWMRRINSIGYNSLKLNH